MAKVSVIIPTYNRAKFIQSAINSVLNQTFQDYEIIIVDDGSIDNTESIVKRFSCENIKYIRHNGNKGEAESRNTGVKNSKTELIAFLDDDDEWLPEKLQAQIELMNQFGKQVGCIYTGFIEIDTDNGSILGKSVPQKRGDIYDDLLIENCVYTPSTVLVRSECFKNVGLFDTNIKFGTDYDMWIRISREYQFECIRDPLVKYNVHQSRLSGDYEKFIEGQETILRKYGEILSKHKKAKSRHLFELGLAYCETDRASKGRKALMKAIYLYPWGGRRYYINFCLSLFGGKIFRQIKRLKHQIISCRG
jgi:glycosyltransferase involved in cell wall biosynthesis